jgi:galactose mutarotase-like enzyme
MITLKQKSSYLSVDLQGGYIDSWVVSELPILYRGTDLKRRGIPILFPYFGKPSAELPQHGFGRDTLWKCVHVDEVSMSMMISEIDISDAARAYYPYRFEATIALTLAETNILQYTLKVKNTGIDPLPISPGLHPYWSIPHDAKKKLIVDGVTGFDAHAVDWDNAPPDTDFAFHNPVTFHTDTYSVTMRDTSPCGDKVNQITIWSQALDKTDHDFVCIEPICGVRGGYVTSPIQIPPHQEWELKIEFTAKLN